MSYQTLISRLENVRTAAKKEGHARAHRTCCPVCGSANGLGVAELADGRVLAHAFCCHAAPAELFCAVGLSLDDVYPPRAIGHGLASNGGPVKWGGVASLCEQLEVLAIETAIALLAAKCDPAKALELLETAGAINKQAKIAMRGAYKGACK